MNAVKATMEKVVEGIVQTQTPARHSANEEESEVSPHRKCKPKRLPRHRQPGTNLFHVRLPCYVRPPFTIPYRKTFASTPFY